MEKEGGKVEKGKVGKYRSAGETRRNRYVGEVIGKAVGGQ